MSGLSRKVKLLRLLCWPPQSWFAPAIHKRSRD